MPFEVPVLRRCGDARQADRLDREPRVGERRLRAPCRTAGSFSRATVAVDAALLHLRRQREHRQDGAAGEVAVQVERHVDAVGAGPRRAAGSSGRPGS